MRIRPASRMSATGSPRRPSSTPAPATSRRLMAPLAAASSTSTWRRNRWGRSLVMVLAPVGLWCSIGRGHLIDEARDLPQLIAGNDTEIHAPDDRRSALGRERPGEADARVVSVNLARARKPVPGKARLDALDHGIDAVATVTPHQGIEVACIRCPDGGDEITPTHPIRLVPHGDVAIDQARNLVHFGSPCAAAAGLCACRAHTLWRPGLKVDYAAGKRRTPSRNLRQPRPARPRAWCSAARPPAWPSPRSAEPPDRARLLAAPSRRGPAGATSARA